KGVPPIYLDYPDYSIYSRLLDMNLETQTHQLSKQHLEGFGHISFRKVLSLHDCLVDLGSSLHIVTLHGKHLFQDVCRTVCIECPHFHLSETLPSKLRLASQRLLGDERVGADGPGMHLVFNQVVEL